MKAILLNQDDSIEEIEIDSISPRIYSHTKTCILPFTERPDEQIELIEWSLLKVNLHGTPIYKRNNSNLRNLNLTHSKSANDE
jgi:hypothetical protein